MSSTPLSATATDLYWCIVFEAIFVAISAAFQRVAIAIKYAMMSQRDYEAVMTTEQACGGAEQCFVHLNDSILRPSPCQRRRTMPSLRTSL